MLSQWKVFDNLRRSLVPAALTLLLLLGWTVLSPAWFWTAVVVGILLVPSVIASLSDLADKPAEVPFGQHLAGVGTRCAAARRAGAARARLPALRGVFLPRCDRAHDRADADHPPALAGMESVERRGSRAGGARPHGPARVLSLHGDRPGNRRRRVGRRVAQPIPRRWRSPARSCCCGRHHPPSPGG